MKRHVWYLSFISLATLNMLPLQARAQDKPTPADLVVGFMMLQNCNASSVGVPENTSDAFVVDIAGNVYRAPDVTPSEEDRIRVFLVGPRAFLPLTLIRRISPTRDPDLVRLIGDRAQPIGPLSLTDSTLQQLGLSKDLTCDSKEIQLGDFAPSEGKFATFVVPGTRPIPVAEVVFAVRKVFKGAISFGPIVSFLPKESYEPVLTGFPSTELDTVLAVKGGELDVHYAVAFTYYWGGPRVLDNEVSYGPFVAFPVKETLDNVFAGLSVDFGSGLFIGHLGVRFGKVERLVKQLDLDEGAEIPSDTSLLKTEQVWKGAFAFGASVDANAAAKAFGGIISSLAGK